MFLSMLHMDVGERDREWQSEGEEAEHMGC